MNPLQELQQYGQSFWLDYIQRGLITSGELQRLVREDGLRGVTSNPAIFEKAISGSNDYADTLQSLSRQGLDTVAIYEQLTIHDIQDAADTLRPVYDDSKGRDGYVSLEVSPHLANDTDKTIHEARRLWKAVGRNNLMIKVPGTREGIPAVEQLISEGINVNVTLLFAQEAYESAAMAYIGGLENRAAKGGDVGTVASVASFFVSRIDSAIDKLVAARLDGDPGGDERERLQSVAGRVAIANAKLAYIRYKEIIRSDRWGALAAKGAQTQRVLWASTSTKNPNYRDVLYVEELIGSDTVNTIPPATLDAFRDHGQLRESLDEDSEGAAAVMKSLEQLGISMTEITDTLLCDGVRLFTEPFDKLLGTIEEQCRAGTKAKVSR
ncbi:MAG: transaldolase [Thermodesulfobacteriota bacterium]